MIGLFSNYGTPMRIQGSVRKAPLLVSMCTFSELKNLKKSVKFLAKAVITL